MDGWSSYATGAASKFLALPTVLHWEKNQNPDPKDRITFIGSRILGTCQAHSSSIKRHISLTA
eukprot:3003598-Amphidinium_carterae.1